jgi:uncharacterized membrane protein
VTEPQSTPDGLRGARIATLASAGVLAACVTLATLRSAPWPAALGWTVAVLAPLLLLLPGLLRGQRRAHAGATLCVTPYLIYGLTEVIANPASRAVAAAILVASLAWFVALVNYLRLTRPGGRHGSPLER